MLKWIRALVERYTHDEEAKRRVAAGFRLCIDCAHHRGGIHDIPYYCADPLPGPHQNTGSQQ